MTEEKWCREAKAIIVRHGRVPSDAELKQLYQGVRENAVLTMNATFFQKALEFLDLTADMAYPEVDPETGLPKGVDAKWRK